MPQTQISQTSFQPPTEGLGNSPFIRFYYTGQNFIAGDGVTPVIIGDGQTGFYIDHVCSIVDDRVVMPAIDLWATTDGSPATSRFFGQLYTESGSPTQYMLFGQNGGWQLPTIYGAVIAYDQLMRYNAAAYLLSAAPQYLNRDQVIAEIQRIAGDFAYAAVGVAGITEMDVAPADAAHPISVGSNSYASTSHLGIAKVTTAPLVTNNPLAISNNDPRAIDISNYASFAAMISAVGSTPTTFNIHTNISVTANATVPSTLTLRFLQGGKFTISTGVVLTINGPIIADPIQIFAGAGTVALASSSEKQKDFWIEWWGCTDDGVTDNATTANAAIAAMPNGMRLRLAGTGDYAMSAELLIDHKMQLTIEGNASYMGLGDPGTKPRFLYIGAASGGNVAKMNHCYSCTVRGVAFYGYDGTHGKCAKGVYMTQDSGSGHPSLSSKNTLDACLIHAGNGNDRSDWIGLDISNPSAHNNEQHIIRRTTFYGGLNQQTLDLQVGIAIRLGHVNVKQITFDSNQIIGFLQGISVIGSFRAINNIFNLCQAVWHMQQSTDACYVIGDDIENIIQYVTSVIENGTLNFIANRLGGIRNDLGAYSAAKPLIQVVGGHAVVFDGLETDMIEAHDQTLYLVSGSGVTFRGFIASGSVLQAATTRNFAVNLAEEGAVIIGFDGSQTHYGTSAFGFGNYANATTTDHGASRMVWALPGTSSQQSITGAAPFPTAGSLYLGGTAIEVGGLIMPPIPTVSVVGTAGATTRAFRLVARDSVGNRVTSYDSGGSFTRLTNSPATLNGTDYLHFEWPAQYPDVTDYLLIDLDLGGGAPGRIAATITPSGTEVETYDLQVTPSGAYNYTLPSVNETTLIKFAGSIAATNVIATTTTYTVRPCDSTITCDATGGSYTVTLPAAAAANRGRRYTFKRLDASGNLPTIDGGGSQIDGAATYTGLSAQWKFIVVESSGSRWLIVAAN